MDKVYHFTNVEGLLKIILTNSFMINSIRNMNDLTESEPLEFCEESNNLNDYILKNCKYNYPYEINKSIVINDLNGTIDKFTNRIFLGCFNILNNESIKNKHLLWSHYANKYSGVAIEIDLKKFENLLKVFLEDLKKDYNIKNIIYISGKIDYIDYDEKILESKVISENIINILRDHKSIDTFDNMNKIGIDKCERDNALKNIIQKKYLTKNIEWKNENEYRVIFYVDNGINLDNLRTVITKRYFIKDFISCINEIIIGPKMSNEDKLAIENLNNLLENKFNIKNYYD